MPADQTYSRCPVCQNPDPHHYMRCDYPGCTDGRHPGGAVEELIGYYAPPGGVLGALLVGLVLLLS